MSRPNGDSPPRMRGATASVAGSRGAVPKPTAGQHNFMLLGDGTWGAQPIAGLPSQTSNSGKLLTTDGTNASWTTTGVLTSLTSPAATDLTLAGGSSGASLVLGQGATKPATLTTSSGSFLLSGGKQIFSVSDPDVDGEQIRFNRASDALRYSSIFTLSKGGGLATMSFLVHDGVSSTSQVTVATMTGAGNLLIGGTTDISGTGGVKVFGTTAGSANAGALVIAGGISAGNTGSAASYFGGAATFAGAVTVSGSALVQSGTADPFIHIKATADTYNPYLRFEAWDRSFFVGVRDTGGDGLFSIAATSALTSPLFSLAVVGGAATFSGAVTAPAAGYSINASGTYGMSLLQIDNSLDRLGLTAGASVSGATFTARYAAPMVVRMAPDVGVFQICVDSGKTIGNAYTPTGQLEISSTSSTFSGTVIVPAATASLAPLRIPHGTAPTSPTNGDMWTTTAGLYIRINGATVGPLS